MWSISVNKQIGNGNTMLDWEGKSIVFWCSMLGWGAIAGSCVTVGCNGNIGLIVWGSDYGRIFEWGQSTDCLYREKLIQLISIVIVATSIPWKRQPNLNYLKTIHKPINSI